MTTDTPVEPFAASPETKRLPRTLIERAVLAGAVVFPLAPGLIAACNAGYIQGSVPLHVSVVVVAFAALLITLMRQDARLCAHKPWWFFIQSLTCALLAVVIRAIVQGQLHSILSSDFAYAHENATELMSGPTHNLYLARYPYWGLFAIVLSYVYRAFGNGRAVYEGFNLVCAGITTVALCYAGRKSSRSPAVGLVAGILFAMWPSLIVYSRLLTPEHVFILLFPCAYLAFEQACAKPRARLAGLVLTGFLIGLMDCFKPVAVAMLVACWIALVLRADPADVPQRLVDDRTPWAVRGRRALWISLLMIILGGSYEATKRACYLLVEYEAGYPVNTSGLGETLRVGLDPRGNGHLTPAIKERLEEVEARDGSDFEATNRTLLNETLRIVTKNSSRMPRLLLHKFVHLWSSDRSILTWATRVPPGKVKLNARNARVRYSAAPWLHGYSVLVLSLACAGALRGALGGPSRGIVVLALFTSGVAAILLLTEVQPRYRSVMAPALAVLAAYGTLGVSRSIEEGASAAMVSWRKGRSPRRSS